MPVSARGPIDPRDLGDYTDVLAYRVALWSAGLNRDDYELTATNVQEALDWALTQAGDDRTPVLEAIIELNGHRLLVPLYGTHLDELPPEPPHPF